MTARPQPRGWRLLLIFAVSLVLAGCTAGGSSDTAITSSADTQSSVSPGHPDRAGEAAVHAEYMERQWDCFRDRGIEVDESGGNPQIKAGGDQIQAAMTACEKKLGPEPVPAPLTDEEITSLYNQSVTAKACLENLGYTVSEPPTLAKFAEDYRSFEATGNPWPWWPFEGIREPDFDTCPNPSVG